MAIQSFNALVHLFSLKVFYVNLFIQCSNLFISKDCTFSLFCPECVCVCIFILRWNSFIYFIVYCFYRKLLILRFILIFLQWNSWRFYKFIYAVAHFIDFYFGIRIWLDFYSNCKKCWICTQFHSFLFFFFYYFIQAFYKHLRC